MNYNPSQSTQESSDQQQKQCYRHRLRQGSEPGLSRYLNPARLEPWRDRVPGKGKGRERKGKLALFDEFCTGNAFRASPAASPHMVSHTSKRAPNPRLRTRTFRKILAATLRRRRLIDKQLRNRQN